MVQLPGGIIGELAQSQKRKGASCDIDVADGQATITDANMIVRL